MRVCNVLQLGFVIDLCICIRSFELPRYYTHPGLPIGHRAHETKGVGEPCKRIISKWNLESSVEGDGVSFSSVEAYENHIGCRVSVICSSMVLVWREVGNPKPKCTFGD